MKIVLFFLSFSTSIISASLGMSRLLLTGPSKFVRKTGRLGGYCQWGFVLLILSIITGIISKAAWLPLVIDWPTRSMGYLGAILWIGVSLIPQLLLVRFIRSMDQVSIIKLKQFLFQALSLLIFHCGCKKAMIILTRWPSYVLLPMFSIYTFGAKTVQSRKYLVLSTNWTWVNFFLTLCGITFGAIFVYLIGPSYYPYYVLLLRICFPLISVTLFTFSCLRYLKACCCNVFDISFIQQYGLDIESLQVVNIEELAIQSDIEMSPRVQAADDSDF